MAGGKLVLISKRKRRGKTKTKVVARYKRVTKTMGLTEKINTQVMNILNKRVEKKHLDMDPELYPWLNSTLDNSLPFGALNLASYYQLSKGDDDGQRIGNEIHIKRCDFCCNVAAINSNTQGPFIVDIWFGYAKPQQSFPPTATQLSLLLQDGSSATGQNNRTSQLLRRVNKDLFTITNHKRFKIGNQLPGTNSQTNNDFPMFRNLRIPLKKLLGKMNFNDDSAVPSKFLYFWCHCVAVNSNVLVQTSLPEINWYLDMEYTDM